MAVKGKKKNYSNADLRGRSFKNADLADADFSGSDIRSVDFSGAHLTDADFTNVCAGIRPGWLPFILFIFLVILMLSGLPFVVTFWWLPYFLIPEITSKTFYIPFLVVVALFIVTVFRAVFPTEEPLLFMAMIGLGVVFFVLITLVAGSPILAIGIGVSCLCSIIGMISISAGAAALIGAKIIGKQISVFILMIFAAGLLWMICAQFPNAILEADKGKGVAQIIFDAGFGEIQIFTTVLGGILSVVISGLVAYKVSLEDKSNWITRLAVFLISVKGTKFQDANLTDVDFTGAELKCANFSNSDIIRTRWEGVKNLVWTRTGKSYLSITEIRELVVSLNGEGKSYTEMLNLVGLNLKNALLNGASFNSSVLNESTLEGAKLNRVNFTSTRLVRAILRGAELNDANLSKTQLDFADLTGVEMTGACVDGWNITETTKLDNVDCNYIFLESDDLKYKRRQPANEDRNFSVGEFSKYIVPILKTLDLFHNKDANPYAIAVAYEEIFNVPDVDAEMVSIEKKGDSILFRLKVPDESTHSQLAYNYEETYEKLKTLPASTLSMMILRYYNKEAILLAKQAEQIIDPVKNRKLLKATNGDESHNNLAEEIERLSPSIEFNDYNLKRFLGELKSALESDLDMSADIKEALLQQLLSLAKAARQPDNPLLQRTTETALFLLEELIKDLPETAETFRIFNKVNFEAR